MQPVIVIHYHEIALKGRNRDRFEYQLMEHIRRVVRGIGNGSVHRMSGRIVFRVRDVPDEVWRTRVGDALRRVFGIAHFGFGYEIRQDHDGVCEDTLAVLRSWPTIASARTFAVRAKRSSKAYPETSHALECRIGEAICSATSLRVDLEHPDVTVAIEMVERTAFVVLERVPGPGGLPVGVSGQVVTLLSSGFDSPVATWMCMRRGAVAVAVHFHSYPYTSDASIRNVRSIVETLARWQGTMLLYTIPIIDFQRMVMLRAPHELRVLLYRRMMVRLAECVARDVGAGALVTGENLGQVASQTLPNIAAIDAVAGMPILRPLIGFDKMDIIARAEEIGTAEIARRPYDDCCSLFTPAHPATAVSAAILDRIEGDIGCTEWTPKLFGQRTSEFIPNT